MPTFQYKAKTQGGELVTGSLAAGDRRMALAQLGRMGYFPLTVDSAQAVATEAKSRNVRLEFRKRMSQREVLAFTQQMFSLLRSGMQLSQALGTLAKRSTKPHVKVVLEQLYEEIVQGTSLSDGLAKHPRVFSKLYINLVKAGEASGTLDGVLERLVKHHEQVGEVREKVITALIYPVIVSFVGLGTIVFFMVVMVPKFSQMFKELHRVMPLPTRILIAVSDLTMTFWWVPVLLVVAAVVVYKQQMRTAAGRLKIDGMKLKLPLVGQVIMLGAFAQFARTLATLMENGVPVLTALQIVEDTMTNEVIAREIREARTRVTDGTSISQPLAKGKIFPPLFIDMLAVGEESGGVVPALKNIADTYERDLGYRLKVFTTALEPAIIILMALVVGAIVLSVLLAVFDMTSGIGKQEQTMKRTQAGFTLIEIMLVVVIIGILMTVVVVKLGGRAEEARVTAARADIKSYSQALDLFDMDNTFYPTTEQGLKALESKPTASPEPKNWKGYLQSALRDDPWSRPYVYKYPSEKRGSGFDLYSFGPDGVEGTEDDITNWK